VSELPHIPYGYEIVNGNPVIRKVESQKIITLFHEYLETKSMRAAAKKAGINKTHSSIGRIIESKVYVSDAFYPPILDEKIFNLAQEIRKENVVKQNRLNRPSLKENEKEIIVFKLNKPVKKYSDPYSEAEYIYSLIREEKVNE